MFIKTVELTELNCQSVKIVYFQRKYELYIYQNTELLVVFYASNIEELDNLVETNNYLADNGD